MYETPSMDGPPRHRIRPSWIFGYDLAAFIRPLSLSAWVIGTRHARFYNDDGDDQLVSLWPSARKCPISCFMADFPLSCWTWTPFYWHIIYGPEFHGYRVS